MCCSDGKQIIRGQMSNGASATSQHRVKWPAGEFCNPCRAACHDSTPRTQGPLGLIWMSWRDMQFLLEHQMILQVLTKQIKSSKDPFGNTRGTCASMNGGHFSYKALFTKKTNNEAVAGFRGWFPTYAFLAFCCDPPGLGGLNKNTAVAFFQTMGLNS